MKDEKRNIERIMGVAVRRPSDGQYWYSAKPARHGDVIHAMANTVTELGGVVPGDFEQGFVTTRLNFVDRKKAFAIAVREGQLRPRQEGQYNGPELFSEDLW